MWWLICLASAFQPKHALLEAIAEFKAIKERDGGVPVDFGVRGGELEKKNRSPVNLVASGKYYQVSEAVGKAADSVVARVEQLPAVSDATRLFGTVEGAKSALHGGWKNLWTTAADATFDAKSKRGDADVCNLVDARAGKITNVITFKAADRKVDQLRVKLTCRATSPTRIELVFRSVIIRFTKRFFGLKQVRLPIPALTITRILAFFGRTEKPNPAFFDVLYLDHDLRVQKTGDGNIFIQQKLDPAIISI